MALIKRTSVFGEKQPPTPEFKEQYLFLLEFYVHEIRGNRLAKLNQMFFVPTCVSFQFLDFKDDDLEVTPVDPMFEPQAGISDDVEYFYSGRSIMFSVAQHIVSQKISEFKIKLTVRKKMPEEINPDILVGEAEIDMTKQFSTIRKEMLQCWYIGVPPPQVFENEVPLFFKQDLIGSIKVFIRLSSYGQSITTEFETPSGGKSYIFKGNKINDKGLSYKCRVIDSKEVDIFKESKDDFSKEAFCEVCQPKRHPCSPCGLSIGAVAKQDLEKSYVDECLKQGDFAFGLEGQEREGRRNEIPCETVSGNLGQSVNRTGPIQTSRGPAQPCGNAVVLKVSGLLDVGEDKQPTVTVANELDAQNCDPDPDHDVFILRIGKKGLVGPDEKSDLQLEMRTPKGPERRPPIRRETREAQTEDEDTGTKKAKGGKGKKKK